MPPRRGGRGPSDKGQTRRNALGGRFPRVLHAQPHMRSNSSIACGIAPALPNARISSLYVQ
eukprot:scaffold3330_cov128-Isochrysis_galbana.AAC.8